MASSQALPDATLTGISRYPVKSCRGEELSSAVIEPWGLAGDRRWMVVDQGGRTLTARECPRLVLVVPVLTETGVRLVAPGMADLEVATPAGARTLQVSVWGDTFQAMPASEEASAWFGELTGQVARLVYFDDPRRRPTNPSRSRSGDVVSFADGYPMLLASESSLAELNGWVATGARADEGPLPMSRFRPNLVVSGAAPWAEDQWRRVQIGGATFRAVKACERCVLTLIDPETALKTKEPLYSLARHRQWDHKTWFAVNLLPDTAGATLELGDQVQVLESATEPGPQR
ncbi:MAG TPA: MOSC N-terminal beta barrel domain-containing protein [Propionibacteriaceae bacterium]|jgi:hypothetical protein